MSHLAEKRKRGKRTLCCHDVVLSGRVEPVSTEIATAVLEQARKERNAWRKKGRTNCLVEAPAKRRLALVPDASDVCSPPADCPNAFKWADIRPKKRICTKSSLDIVLREAIQN